MNVGAERGHLICGMGEREPSLPRMISPSGAVLEMAPVKVLQAVRLQGLASSPTPDTQVRVAWA